MIITETFFGLKCDRCGELFEGGEHSFWHDESSAIENATDSDWQEVKGKHYCTGCSEVDEETDEVIVYPEYPKHLKILNAFLDKITSATSRTVIESAESYFIVKCRFYNKQKLEPFEAEYIKSLLGEFFVSIDYIDEKYNSLSCLIKIAIKTF